jgi:hypothetical protein
MLDFSHVVSAPGVDIQSFFGNTDASGQSISNLTDWKVWTKPRGVNWVYMIGVGAGSSGAAGTVSTAAATGGLGGGSGAQTTLLMPAFFVPNQLFIQTGLGGRNASTSNTATSASASVAGTNTYIAIEPVISTTSNTNVFFLYASGAASGTTGGVATAMSGNFPLAGRGWFQNFAGGNGTAGGAAQAAGTALTLPTTGIMVTGGTGGGGTDATAAAQFAGGAITGVGLGGGFPTLLGGTAGATGTAIGGPGSNGFMVKPFMFYGGTGSGGDNFATGRVSQPGGNGAPGCGGGGSGAANAAVGRPGDGGDGFVYIISW